MKTPPDKGRMIMKAYASPKGKGDSKSKDQYPMDTIEAARKSLASVAENGTPEEQRRVRRAVYAKYPELKKS